MEAKSSKSFPLDPNKLPGSLQVAARILLSAACDEAKPATGRQPKSWGYIDEGEDDIIPVDLSKLDTRNTSANPGVPSGSSSRTAPNGEGNRLEFKAELLPWHKESILNELAVCSVEDNDEPDVVPEPLPIAIGAVKAPGRPAP